MGHQMCLLQATLCVASSLALSGSYPAYSRVLPYNPKLLATPQPLGAIGDKAHVSLADVIGMMCEELGRWVNLVYQSPYCI
jgi:hypothetical protein